jgi:hypothetical protein
MGFVLTFASLSYSAYAQEVVEEETSELVDFVSNIEFIKGHLSQAIVNKQAGQDELAIAHAGHPAIEHYYLIEEKVAEHDSQLNTQLKDNLAKLPNEISSSQSEAVEMQVARINMMLDQAKDLVVDQNVRSNPEFNALVIISVLRAAEIEYEEAVSEGMIIEIIEYQDCIAFIARAEVLSDSIKAQIPERERNTIPELYEYLDSLTAANMPFEQVRLTMRAIGHNYAQVFQFEAIEPVADGQVIIDNINLLLDEAVAEYRDGNPERARARVLDAYLGNYEYIELDIAEENRELMLKIEIDMHEELVQLIEAGRPASEIEAMVNEIKLDLESARAFVVPEFSEVLVAVAVVTTAVIVMGRLKGLNLFNHRAF